MQYDGERFRPPSSGTGRIPTQLLTGGAVAYERAIGTDERDWSLGDLVSMAVESLERLFGPDEIDIKEAEHRILGFLWGLAGPLLHAPSSRALLSSLSLVSPETTRELAKLTKGRAARTALERARRKSAVHALRPNRTLCSPRTAEMSHDFARRATELVDLIIAKENLAGFRRPANSDTDLAFARFLTLFVSISLSAVVPGVPEANVQTLFEEGNRAIDRLAHLFRITSERLETRISAQLAAEAADAAEQRAEERIRLARELADDSAAIAAE